MTTRRSMLLTMLITACFAWAVAEAAVAADCRWTDMDSSETGTQELVDYGSPGCGENSWADYNNIYGCPCGMTVAITVDVGNGESWSIQTVDPVTGDHNIDARSTGVPSQNPVVIQVAGYTCGTKLSIRMVVDCADGTTNMPIDLHGYCNDQCD